LFLSEEPACCRQAGYFNRHRIPFRITIRAFSVTPFSSIGAFDLRGTLRDVPIELNIKEFRSEDFPELRIEPEPLWTSIALMHDDFNLSRFECDELERAVKLELSRPTHKWCTTGDYSSHMFAVVHGWTTFPLSPPFCGKDLWKCP